jgi:hypothetical protein
MSISWRGRAAAFFFLVQNVAAQEGDCSDHEEQNDRNNGE